MSIEDAIRLLKCPELTSAEGQQWADLGCGNGLFTCALAQLLPPDSRLYATDTNKAALAAVPESYNGQRIEKIPLDFVGAEWPFDNLDGILMANSLHYVRDQYRFLDKAKRHLKEKGSFLIIEYDTLRSNRWIPFPVSFSSLEHLFAKSGYKSISKIHQQASIYHRFGMYSAIITR